MAQTVGGVVKDGVIIPEVRLPEGAQALDLVEEATDGRFPGPGNVVAPGPPLWPLVRAP
jgi:hypothetical protein